MFETRTATTPDFGRVCAKRGHSGGSKKLVLNVE